MPSPPTRGFPSTPPAGEAEPIGQHAVAHQYTHLVPVCTLFPRMVCRHKRLQRGRRRPRCFSSTNISTGGMTVHPTDLHMTTQVVGHGRFLFVRIPEGGIDAELAAAIDDLGLGLENMHETEGPLSE